MARLLRLPSLLGPESSQRRSIDVIAWNNGQFMKSKDDPRIDEYGLREQEQQRQAQERINDAAAAAQRLQEWKDILQYMN